MISHIDNEVNGLAVRFLEGVRSRISKMVEAVIENDRLNLRGYSHQLKGTSMSYGFATLADLASEIEQRALLAETDWVTKKLEAMEKIVDSELSQYSDHALS